MAILSSAVIEPPGTGDRRSLYVLHGVYGRGRNWTSIARQLAERRADWRSVLTDLRAHGDSPPMPGPNTIGEAAKDVARLAIHLERPVEAVLGHSFGGKVALHFAAVAPPALRQVWVIDSTPAPRVPDGSAWRMLEIARRHPGPFTTRAQAIAALESEGVAPAVASWMATNVSRKGGVYGWRIDFDAMEALLRDFFRADLWHVIEMPPPGLTIHVVKGSESSLIGPDVAARIEQASRAHRRVHLHHVQGGHWLNTDNPAALVALLARELPRRTRR
jgi:pimeloyl-ACP methyl ester carboxylesterase